MKKHILIASFAVLALGLASAASADPIDKKDPLAFKDYNNEVNHSQINQIGGNEATVEQAATFTGTDNQNQSDIYQHGFDNKADVKQIGQGTTSGGTTNISAIDQGGANLAVYGNSANVLQKGNDNKNSSSISQQSSGNTVSVTQSNDTPNFAGTGGNTNTSIVTQGRFGFGGSNTAEVHQGGTDATNYSEIEQTGHNGTAKVEQAGTDTVNTSLIIQSGLNDEAYVSQSGSNISNHSYINQSGCAGNYANVTQY